MRVNCIDRLLPCHFEADGTRFAPSRAQPRRCESRPCAILCEGLADPGQRRWR
jgi:hypothetical protein